MEFNIIDPTAPKFADAVMSKEKQDYISKKLDQMTAQWKDDDALRVSDIMTEIALFCNTPEELVYATILHFTWWAKRGVLIS